MSAWRAPVAVPALRAKSDAARVVARLMRAHKIGIEYVDVLRPDLIASRGEPSASVRHGRNEGYVVTCGVRGQDAVRLVVLGSEADAFDAARLAFRMLSGTPRTWARAHGGAR